MHNRDNLESGSGVSNPKWSPIQISSHLLPTTTREYHQSLHENKLCFLHKKLFVLNELKC